MIFALKILTLVLVVVTVSLSLAHALELPGKMRLEREQYLAVQPIYYPGFTYAGICEPAAVAALIALLILTPGGTPAFWLIAGALAAAVLESALYWILTAPVNRVWMQGQKLSGSAQKFFGTGDGRQEGQDWKVLRNRWERSHVYRAIAAAASFFLLSMAVVT
jgi:hypothetical protein